MPIELGVGKSVVSKRVAQLEELIGATLFARGTRRIALTPAGEAYAEFARRALAEMAAGVDRLRALRSALTGRIRMSATVSCGQRVLAGKLPEFLRLHAAGPDVRTGGRGRLVGGCCACLPDRSRHAA
ncbi:MAG: LysR family transcriptional regulator [Bacteriovorax sp.]|nr:LysR family transcriptional regulator [Rhizobacter sp.]